jgi:class 3 adenylate cyclase/GAF domain-containing protein
MNATGRSNSKEFTDNRKLFDFLQELEKTKIAVGQKEFQLSSIYEFSRLIHSVEDNEKILKETLYLIMGLIGTDGGNIYLYDNESSQFNHIYVRGIEKEFSHTIRKASLKLDEEDKRWLLNFRFPIVIESKIEESPFVKKNLPVIQMRGDEVLIPLMAENKLIGMLGINKKLNKETYTPDDLVILALISNIASIALEKNYHLQSLRASNEYLNIKVRNLAVLDEITKIINSSFNFESIGIEILKKIIEVFQAEAGILLKVEDKEFLVQEIIGNASRFLYVKDGKTYLHSKMNELIHKQKALIIPDKNFNETLLDIASLLFAVIQYRNIVYGGIILITEDEKRIFSSNELELLKMITNQISISIENKKLLLESLALQKEKFRIRGLFEHYFPPQIVSKLIDEKMQKFSGGQFLKITTLVADMRGFVSLCEILPPEEILDFLNKYYSEVTNIMGKYDGIIDKFIGDGVMVVFGIPFQENKSTENTSEQNAILSAVELQKSFGMFVKKWGKEHFKEINAEIGIGICTGKTFVGNVGPHIRLQYTVLGREVNLAARLASVCKGTQILTDEKTVQNFKKDDILLDKGIEIMERAPVLIKGINKEIKIFEILYQENVNGKNN